MKTKDIPYEGAVIRVFTNENAKTNPLVFLHGNSLSSLTFQKQFEKLDLPFIAIDLPGHGQSEPAKNPESTYSIPGYAKAVAYIINQMNLDQFILAGHSLGGHIAINVAAELKNTSGLVIFGTPPLDSVASLGLAFLPNPLMPLLFHDAVADEQALQLADSMLLQKEYKNDLKKYILATDPSARSSFGAFVGKGIITDEVAIIKSLSFPVAILHGESDSFIKKEYIDGIGFSNLWKGKVQQINNSGHCPQLEQSAVFNTMLLDYYKAVFV